MTRRVALAVLVITGVGLLLAEWIIRGLEAEERDYQRRMDALR